MGNRLVRMGIDVGGTHTKAVAIDNATHEIIGKSSVKTTHDDRYGVAAGVVKAFQNCLRENDIAPEDVIFVAHSTTQATNALIEGDVACVGVLGMGPGGMEGFLAKHQTRLKDIDLGSGTATIAGRIARNEKAAACAGRCLLGAGWFIVRRCGRHSPRPGPSGSSACDPAAAPIRSS